MSRDPLFILAVLGLNIALSEWLVRHSFLRHLGTALVVIVVTAISANLGLIPSGSDPAPLYDVMFGDVAYGAIFLLLLGVSLRDLARAGGPMIALFALGAAGTLLGVITGMAVVGGAEAFGERHAALGGMFVATYTGGSLNFNILAAEYGVASEGLLYTGAIAIDSIMTSVWMVITIMVPRGLRSRRQVARQAEVAALAATGGAPVSTAAEADVLAPAGAGVDTGVEQDTERAHPFDLAVLLLLVAGSLWVSGRVTAAIQATWDVRIPSIVVVSTIALVLAQIPAVRRLNGARLLGMLGVYLFLAVIGAYCDVGALNHMGALGVRMLGFVSVVLAVHGVVVFGGARLLGMDRDMAAVASQANIGGGSTALALARSLGRSDLVLPGILVGSIGTATGTYLGVIAVEFIL